MTVHLLKLSVGTTDVESMRANQARRTRTEDGMTYVPGFTRRKPRRALEITESGSIYWVIKGAILVRQRVLDLVDAVDHAGEPYCELRLDSDLIDVVPRPHRPFQGWRYLKEADAPPDLGSFGDEEMPAEMAAELKFLGLI